MARTFDENQKNAINIDINSVVSAGAGSGKTTVLSERFLNLINTKNCNVDEILTLTFTKKATVEMSDRIYKVLQKNKPEQAANFYKANIKTLDAFCSGIAKAGAHYYGISPDFQQDKDTIEEQATALALPYILQNRDNEAIKILVNTQNYAQIAKDLFVDPVMRLSTVIHPIDFDKCVENQCELISTEWNKVQNLFVSFYNYLKDQINNFSGNKNTATYQNIETTVKKFSDFGEVKLSAKTIQEKNSEEVKEFMDAASAFRSLRSPGSRTKGFSEDIGEEFNSFRDLYDNKLLPLFTYIDSFEYIEAVLPLVKQFQDRIINYKRTSGLLTFKDIEDLAVTTLSEHPEIRQIEKEKYRYIMIDEFQDNSRIQRDMLFLLAEKPERTAKGIPSVEELCPEKLFFVGDEKQSIYRFRDADVSVFRSLSDEFPEGNLSMTTNYRSHPALISTFNTIFGGYPYPSYPRPENFEPQPFSVFFNEKQQKELISQHSNVPAFEAVYHEVTIGEEAKKKIPVDDMAELRNFYQPRAHFAWYTKDQEAGENQLTGLEAEGEWIARKIDEILETQTKTVTVREGEKEIEKQVPLSPEDIAIIIRKTRDQFYIEQALLRHGIPYNSSATTGIFSDGPVNDIFAFLRILVYKSDSMSYAQVLRSPYVNLSTEETNSILMESVYPFEAEGNTLSQETKERYQRAKEFYTAIREFSRTNTISRTVSRLWYDSGYFYETIWNQNVSMYNKHYDMIFSLAIKAEQNCQSLASFVDGMRQYTDDSQKLEDLEIPIEQSSGVQIMTIHKSKGLEFEVVFVSQNKHGPRQIKNDLQVSSSKKYGISLNIPVNSKYGQGKVNFFHKNLEVIAQAEEFAEIRRIMYVALTRAKNHLYITTFDREQPDQPENFTACNGGEIKQNFQIMEPVISWYQKLMEDGNDEMIPFTFEEIPPYDRDYNQTTGTRRANSREAKSKLLSQIHAENLYENASVYKTEQIPSIYATPSHLHDEDDETSGSKTLQIVENAPYSQINKLILSTIPKSSYTTVEQDQEPAPRFGFNNFGTIAHAFLEGGVKGEKPEIHRRELLGLENNENKIKIVIDACEEMKNKFLASDMGKKAANSDWKRCEFSFRSRVASKIIKGVVDLVFKNPDGTYTVVDYKTNQTIQPEIYYAQLACYRQAVSQILNVSPEKISCYLYYLRFDKTVDITSECDKIDLIKAVEKI